LTTPTSHVVYWLTVCLAIGYDTKAENLVGTLKHQTIGLAHCHQTLFLHGNFGETLLFLETDKRSFSGVL